MFVIVGLGNPGKKYENTRHNIGFIAVDLLAEENGIKVNKLKHKALVGEGSLSGQKVLFVKPQTYMNLSGQSVREIMEYYKAEPQELIVIYDDIDIPAGAIRIRKKGSAGTHNGMRSIIYDLQYDNFPRIRIGIGSEKTGILRNFVTGGFSKAEKPLLEDAVKRAAGGAAHIVSKGIDAAMNEYNVKPETAEKKKQKEGQKQGKEDEE